MIFQLIVSDDYIVTIIQFNACWVLNIFTIISFYISVLRLLSQQFNQFVDFQGFLAPLPCVVFLPAVRRSVLTRRFYGETSGAA